MNLPATLPVLSQRFLIVLDQLGLSGYAVAQQAEASRTVVSNIRLGKNKPQTGLIEWLLASYPQVNPDYLFRGWGQPLQQAVPTQADQVKPGRKSRKKPVYDYRPSEHHQHHINELKAENAGLKQVIALKGELLDTYQRMNAGQGDESLTVKS